MEMLGMTKRRTLSRWENSKDGRDRPSPAYRQKLAVLSDEMAELMEELPQEAAHQEMLAERVEELERRDEARARALEGVERAVAELADELRQALARSLPDEPRTGQPSTRRRKRDAGS